MNVLIVGFYGVMNAGDDLLQQSLAWLFREHRLTFSRILPSQDAIQQFDLLVIGGGSLWPQHSFFALGDEYARQLRIPFMVLGVSARSYDAGVARKTRLLIERAALFHVRDEQTAQWLDHPGVHVGPDLFWTAPWSGDLEVSNIPDDGIAFAPRSDALAEWPMPDLTDALLQVGPIRAWPFFYGHARFDAATVNDYEALKSVLPNIPESFSLQPLRHARLAFSMRYHGLLCALRAGRPVLIGNVHAKLGIFATENGLDSWQVEDITALCRRVSDMAANYSHERQFALELREKLLTEGHSLATLIHEQTARIKVRSHSRPRTILIAGMRNLLARIS